MPLRVHGRLVAWRAAERERDAFEPGTAEHAQAVARVVQAREAYLESVRLVAEELGSDAMPDLTDGQMTDLGRGRMPGDVNGHEGSAGETSDRP